MKMSISFYLVVVLVQDKQVINYELRMMNYEFKVNVTLRLCSGSRVKTREKVPPQSMADLPKILAEKVKSWNTLSRK